MEKDFITKLKEMDACQEAVEWASAFGSLQEAWDNCSRADWMLWLVEYAPAHPANTQQQIVRLACAIARTALSYIPDGEMRPLQAIETAEAWAEGKKTKEDCNAAEAAARAAAWAAEDAAWNAAQKHNSDLVRQFLTCPSLD